jgi:hypothetical protein
MLSVIFILGKYVYATLVRAYLDKKCSVHFRFLLHICSSNLLAVSILCGYVELKRSERLQ